VGLRAGAQPHAGKKSDLIDYAAARAADREHAIADLQTALAKPFAIV
jgi:hypothetical protein